MKVEYIKCDICGKKIGPEEKRYRYKFLDFYPEADVLGDSKPIEVRLDICDPCFDEMGKLIKEKRRLNNGQST